MAIEFRFDPENKSIFIGEPEKELSLTSDEETLLETVCSFIADHVDVFMLGIENHSHRRKLCLCNHLNAFLCPT